MNRRGSRHGFETRFAYPLARGFAFYVTIPSAPFTRLRARLQRGRRIQAK